MDSSVRLSPTLSIVTVHGFSDGSLSATGTQRGDCGRFSCHTLVTLPQKVGAQFSLPRPAQQTVTRAGSYLG